MRFVDSVEQLRASLDYHLARHNLLTANLAHVDTPGYRPLDLARSASAPGSGSFAQSLETAMVTTDPNHIASPHSASGEQWHVVKEQGSAAGYDGNSVSIDREAVKIATNHVRYEAIASLASNELAGLAWAANDGRGA